ncbi:MAG TPA: UTP--glucose-1-phosphate uridylyltransferase GalU [Alphaproteobacteria bacterium]
MAAPVRTAVFPIAGLGSRFLPATKALAKEMLPVIDKPLIQYAVEEAQAAGIERFVFVTGRGKSLIEDHFDHAYELERTLADAGKGALVDVAASARLAPGALFTTRQQEPLGLGHAVWCAREFVGNEPFAVVLPDDLVLHESPCLAQMMAAYERVGGNLVAVMEVPPEHTRRYGILEVGATRGALVEVAGLVEKPEPEVAPSTLSIIGRYILQPAIMDRLARQERGAGGEIQLTDAMAGLIGKAPFHGFRFAGRRFDCGDKLGYIEATLAFALARDDLGTELRAIIRRLAGQE